VSTVAERRPEELQTIPGVGPSIAADLRELGIERVSDLVGKDPEAMYDTLCRKEGQHIDRCVLYVFRCAIYYASNEEHDQKLLLWWNWKNRNI